MTEPSSNPKLDAIIAEYLDKAQPTESDRDQLINQHPDLADDLNSFFANHNQMQVATQSAEDATIPPSASPMEDAIPRTRRTVTSIPYPAAAECFDVQQELQVVDE